MNNCNQNLHLIPLFYSNLLDEKEKETLLHHIDICKSCDNEFQQYRLLNNILRSYRNFINHTPLIPCDESQMLWNSIHQKIQYYTPHRKGLILTFARIAAMFIMGILIGFIFYLPTHKHTKVQYTANNTNFQPTSIFPGIKVSELNPPLKKQCTAKYGCFYGVIISYLSKQNPLRKYGLRPFDIILSINDQKIYSPEDFNNFFLKYHIKKKDVKLKVIKEGKLQEITIKVPPIPK